MKQVVVIGAGMGGLTAAAALAKAGLDVTVLEAHVYPGGCAGSFYHQGYRFDAGATLAGGFYPGGPMDLVAQSVGISRWPVHPSQPSMVVTLPDGAHITRWGDERRWQERTEWFAPQDSQFWCWQENTADQLWDLALRLPHWPPQSAAQLVGLLNCGFNWLNDDWRRRLRPSLLADLFRPVATHLSGASERLRLFVDAQLLIAAQTTGHSANALFGAAALDLPRRGTVNPTGGMGAIAHALVDAVRRNGGMVLTRQEVVRIATERGRPVAVETKRGESFPADLVVANLTPWNIARLLPEATPPSLKRLPPAAEKGWGAFTTYIGLDGSVVPDDFVLHQQLVAGRPLGEGNSVFLSMSPAWDESRAPQRKRAVTLSTHTDMRPWWQKFEQDRQAYEAHKAAYAQRLIEAAETVLPGVSEAAQLVLPGTPVTFQRFTRRQQGWVGGFPQTSLFKVWGPLLAPGLWMVGDSIFPGQSIAAASLGGLRVAQLVLQESPRLLPAGDRQLASLMASGDNG